MTNDAYQRGYLDGYAEALNQLRTPQQVAKELGCTTHRLRQYAEEIGAGHKLDDRTTIYTPIDLERLKIRKSMDLRLWRKEHGLSAE